MHICHAIYLSGDKSCLRPLPNWEEADTGDVIAVCHSGAFFDSSSSPSAIFHSPPRPPSSRKHQKNRSPSPQRPPVTCPLHSPLHQDGAKTRSHLGAYYSKPPLSMRESTSSQSQSPPQQSLPLVTGRPQLDLAGFRAEKDRAVSKPPAGQVPLASQCRTSQAPIHASRAKKKKSWQTAGDPSIDKSPVSGRWKLSSTSAWVLGPW